MILTLILSYLNKNINCVAIWRNNPNKVTICSLGQKTQITINNVTRLFSNSNAFETQFLFDLLVYEKEIKFDPLVNFNILINLNFIKPIKIRVLNVINTFFFSIEAVFFSKTITKDVIPLPNSLGLEPCLYFSYLEGFDDISTNILLWTNPKLATNYGQYHKDILLNLDRELMRKTTARVPFLFPPWEDLYEFPQIIPFYSMAGYEYAVHWIFAWSKIFYDPRSFFDTYDLTVSFPYEPYFFFWDKVQQTIKEFWLISFYWERGILFEDWVFLTNPNFGDPNSIFPPLSHLSHLSDLKSGWRVMRRLYDYKAIQVFSYYLEYSDIQTYAIDKNFVHLWNYYIGAYHEDNHFGLRGWTGIINYLWEKLYSPRFHYPSQFYWEDYGYGTLGAWMLEFGFFPDTATLWGHYNVNYEWFILGFNWFFHSGDTFIDSMMFLAFIWYSMTENYWGEFELMGDDYIQYQQAFAGEGTSAIWVPMILLLTRTLYWTSKEMEAIIADFDSVFHFWEIKSYKKFTGKFLFPIEPRVRLQLFRDPFTVERRFHVTERLVTLFFGYNASDVLIHEPNWYAWLTDTNIFYGAMRYDYAEDQHIEESLKKLVFSATDHEYNFGSQPSIYFTEQKAVNPFETLLLFLNEKIFDDPGFFSTSLHRTEPPREFSTFKWLEMPMFYAEYLPQEHFSWNIKIFNLGFMELRHTAADFYEYIGPVISRTIDLSFFEGWFAKHWLDGTLFKGEFYYNSYRPGMLTYFIWIDLYPLLHLFKTFWGPSRFDPFLEKFYWFVINLNNWFGAPAYYFDFDTLVQFFSKIFYTFFQNYRIELMLKMFKFKITLDHYIHLEYEFIGFPTNQFLYLTSKSFDILKTIFFFIFCDCVNFLNYPNLRVWLTGLNNVNHLYGAAALESYAVHLTTLPIEFFLPLIHWKNSTFTITSYEFAINPALKANEVLTLWPTGQPLWTWTLEDIEYMMTVMALTQIINFSDTHALPKEYLDAINWIDMSFYKLQKLEYDRYLTYVHRYTCYHRNKF